MTEEQIVGLIILIIGALQAVRPDLLLDMQVWTQRVFMNAKYEPSERTHTIVRIMGAVFVVLGLAILTGLVE